MGLFTNCYKSCTVLPMRDTAHIVCQDSTEPWQRPNEWPLPQAVFTSPRYNKGMAYGTDAEGQVIEDDTDPALYYYHLLDAWRRVHDETAAGASLWVNHKPDDPHRDSVLHTSLIASGWVIQKTFAWVFHMAFLDGSSVGQFNSVPRAVNPHSGFELVRLYAKDGAGPVKLRRDAPGVGVPYSDKTNLTRFTAGTGGQPKEDLRCRGDVWLIPYETRRKRTHPCPFPPGLPEMALRMLDLPPGSVVADPFCGTGATGVAAQACGLRFLGMDLSPAFCEEARSRLYVDRFSRALGALKASWEV